MVGGLFDTNILIDYLNAVPPARAELARFDSRAISIVTWMEVMIGAPPELEEATRQFLSSYEIIALDNKVATVAVEIRREHRIKLPDAIIWASAKVTGRLLITRNSKDFPAKDPGIRVPYKL